MFGKRIILLVIITTVLLGCFGCTKIDDAPGNTISPVQLNRRTPPVIEKIEMIAPTAGKFTVSKVFSDDMILQRDEYIRIWGFAGKSEEGKVICAEFKGLQGYATVQDGEWLITLDGTLSASFETGHTLRVYSATFERTFENVLVGDVYLVVGQSNADYTVRENLKESADDADYCNLFSEEDITDADPIRVIQNLPSDPSDAHPSLVAAKDLRHVRGWQKPSQVAMNTSALGYFFAKQIVERTNGEIPIGLIQCTQGGPPIATFMSAEAAEKCQIDEYDEASNEYKTDGFSGKITSRYMYNQRVAPFMQYTVSGMLWYQGESDLRPAMAAQYNYRFKTLVEDYRSKINQHYRNFPVFVVELPTEYPKPTTFVGDWAYMDIGNVRAQMGLIPSVVENTFLATTGDLWKNTEFWNNLHPYNKYPVSTRVVDLCMPLMYAQYAQKDIVYTAGPVVDTYQKISAKEIQIQFKYVGDGLKTADGKGVRGVQVYAGGEWVTPSKVTLSANTMTVVHNVAFEQVRYYGITTDVFAQQINVCSSSGVPMAAFCI